jgi:hypothetical protein
MARVYRSFLEVEQVNISVVYIADLRIGGMDLQRGFRRGMEQIRPSRFAPNQINGHPGWTQARAPTCAHASSLVSSAAHALPSPAKVSQAASANQSAVICRSCRSSIYSSGGRSMVNIARSVPAWCGKNRR